MSTISRGALVAGYRGNRQAFSPASEMLAIQPKAFGSFWDSGAQPQPFETKGDVAVIEVVGPLMHHEEFWFDSYDAIKCRVATALESPAKCVLLSIDSPGGLVAGCFDTVREIRRMARDAGKRVYSYVDALSASGGYALACAGERIYCPPTGLVGSIGVICTRDDWSSADAQRGVRTHFITSGARKADGNPGNPMTPEELEAQQILVDAQAFEFFRLVGECRGMSVESIQALEAGVFVGAAAKASGLVDQIATFDEVIAMLAAPSEQQPDEGDRGGTQVTYEEIKGALKAIAEGEDSEEKEKARKALAAMEGEPDGDEEKPKEEAKAEAEEENPEHKEPDGDEEKKASAESLAMAARLQKLEAESRARNEADERSKLMASRSDFAPEVVSFLNTQPLSVVRSACKSPDKGGLPLGPGKGGQVSAARAALNVSATQPAGTTDPSDGAVSGRSNLSGHGDQLDRMLGLAGTDNLVEQSGTRLVLHAITPEKARELRVKNGAK